MRATKEKFEFVAVLARIYPFAAEFIADLAQRLMRAAGTHQRLMTEACNNGLYDADENGESPRVMRIRKKINALLLHSSKDIKVTPKFSGDPRGYTVKLLFPTGQYNTWGGAEEGYGVPTN